MTQARNKPAASHARTVAHARSAVSATNAVDARASPAAKTPSTAKTVPPHRVTMFAAMRAKSATKHPAEKVNVVKANVVKCRARAVKADAVDVAVVDVAAMTVARALTAWRMAAHRKISKLRWALRPKLQSLSASKVATLPSATKTAKCGKSAHATVMAANAGHVESVTTATTVAIAPRRTQMAHRLEHLSSSPLRTRARQHRNALPSKTCKWQCKLRHPHPL